MRVTAQHCCSQQIIQATENLFQKCVFTFDLILLFYYSLEEMNFPNNTLGKLWEARFFKWFPFHAKIFFIFMQYKECIVIPIFLWDCTIPLSKLGNSLTVLMDNLDFYKCLDI